MLLHFHKDIKYLPFALREVASRSSAPVPGGSLLGDSSPSLSPVSWSKEELWVRGPCWAWQNSSTRVCCALAEVRNRSEATLHNWKNSLPASPLTLAVRWTGYAGCRNSVTTFWLSTNLLCGVCGFLKDHHGRKGLDNFCFIPVVVVSCFLCAAFKMLRKKKLIVRILMWFPENSSIVYYLECVDRSRKMHVQ